MAIIITTHKLNH